MQGGGVYSPTFFVSYARNDAEYVTRLVEHLRQASLPVWFDGDLTWGIRFTPHIRERIAMALGVLVVMTPAAEASEWVEREILESQRRDREVFPILLRGERMFLLAGTQHFDARDGRLPGDDELERLRLQAGLPASRCGRAPGARTTASVQQSPLQELQELREPREPREPREFRKRCIGADGGLRRVTGLLADGEFELADIATTSVILHAADRLAAGWLRPADGRVLGGHLLSDVDRLWAAATDGLHGFTAQLRECDNRGPSTPSGGPGSFFALAQALGWTVDPTVPAPRYGKFVASPELLRPRSPGFFPTLRNPQVEHQQMWHDHWRQTVLAVHLQLHRSR